LPHTCLVHAVTPYQIQAWGCRELGTPYLPGAESRDARFSQCAVHPAVWPQWGWCLCYPNTAPACVRLL
jgi:hypothetical protein